MPGFRRSRTVNQSLVCCEPSCRERATEMCLEHMAAYCSPHYHTHMKTPHEGKTEKKQD
jgi:hypothetical protein